MLLNLGEVRVEYYVTHRSATRRIFVAVDSSFESFTPLTSAASDSERARVRRRKPAILRSHCREPNTPTPVYRSSLRGWFAIETSKPEPSVCVVSSRCRGDIHLFISHIWYGPPASSPATQKINRSFAPPPHFSSYNNFPRLHIFLPFITKAERKQRHQPESGYIRGAF